MAKMTDTPRWVCMGTTRMDGNVSCEVWIDSFIGKGYGIAHYASERYFIPFSTTGNKVNPFSIGDGNVACFDTIEQARDFLRTRGNN